MNPQETLEFSLNVLPYALPIASAIYVAVDSVVSMLDSRDIRLGADPDSLPTIGPITYFNKQRLAKSVPKRKYF